MKFKLFGRQHKLAKARQNFLNAVKAVNEGKIDKNAPIPGHVGELRGQSKTVEL